VSDFVENENMNESRENCLGDLAIARSGDKGTSANVGVIARTPEAYDRLSHALTTERVEAFFRPMGVTKVDRYVLPNLHAFNFVLHGILRRSTRVDVQGKALGQAMLEMELDG